MIDLKWIIDEENKLTDNAKFKLGDSYMLSLDLLQLLQSIKSMNKDNEVSHYFETQIVKDFHLIILNIIRRHNLVANLLMRHVIESIVLFSYSIDKKNTADYKIIKDGEEIIDYDRKVLKKANKDFEYKIPDVSEKLEACKTFINDYYSHSNIYSAQDNTAIINNEIKLLLFDNYNDLFIRDFLLACNEIICSALDVYEFLFIEYNGFVLSDNFSVKLHEYKIRQSKHTLDRSTDEDLKEYQNLDKIISRIRKKYDKIKKQKLNAKLSK